MDRLNKVSGRRAVCPGEKSRIMSPHLAPLPGRTEGPGGGGAALRGSRGQVH